jgi:hypothetical protein
MIAPSVTSATAWNSGLSASSVALLLTFGADG